MKPSFIWYLHFCVFVCVCVCVCVLLKYNHELVTLADFVVISLACFVC